MTGILINLIVAVISQCISISKHCIIHLKYLLLKDFASFSKAGKKETKNTHFPDIVLAQWLGADYHKNSRLLHKSRLNMNLQMSPYFFRNFSGVTQALTSERKPAVPCKIVVSNKDTFYK